MPLAPLPVDAVLPELIAALGESGAVVLRAPTGAGKTTRVAPTVLDAGLAGSGSIVVLQPRRLAARASARRMALERGTRVGGEIGYQVRFDRCTSAATRIHVVTEGILLRLLQDDPFLESFSVVVFDEFHERNLDSDLALAMLRRVRETVRPELKLVVMSATLDPQPIARYLGGCPVVESQGRLHPVAVSYVEDVGRRSLAERAAEATRRILDDTTGDVLVFLPGVGEIRQTTRRLGPLTAARNLAVMPLYGDLSPEQQDAVLAPLARRKIVLATNVAETSITIEGITGVVDTGLARALSFDPQVGIDRLQLVRISQAAADQRMGRAGRMQPGVCLRLWPERTHAHRPAHEEPEIRRRDLAGPVLQLRAWGENELTAFPWFEAPAAAALEQAEALLRRLEALDASGRVTATGRAMVRLPVGPRLARMLLEGRRLGQPESVALAAALLAERDPFARDEEGPTRRQAVRTGSESDVLDRVAALEEFEHSGRLATPLGSLNRTAARFVLHVRDQLLRELRAKRSRADRFGAGLPTPLSPRGRGPGGEGATPPDHEVIFGREHKEDLRSQQELGLTGPQTAHPSPDEAVLRALLAAFPDRLVRRTSPGSRFGRLVGGRGVRLADCSAVRDAALFLAVDVGGGTPEAVVWQASAVERSWLPAEHLSLRTEVEFDRTARRVIARRRFYWEDLLLEETPEALPAGEEPARILAAAAAESLADVFPWDDPATAQYVARLRCLAQWMPELNLPALDDALLGSLLPGLCYGRRSFDELRRGPWIAAIQGLLTPQQWQAIEREAPERIEVPSGSRITLHYEPGKPPVLAVRIQEVFGLLETPRVARGRVRILLHLLGPNMRPQQVTDDLESFWRTTYHQVRKDLRRRYPKHAWPEDPYQAIAQRRPRRNG